jgi:hypothetical protein
MERAPERRGSFASNSESALPLTGDVAHDPTEASIRRGDPSLRSRATGSGQNFTAASTFARSDSSGSATISSAWS